MMKNLIFFLICICSVSCNESSFTDEFLPFEIRLAQTNTGLNLEEMSVYKSEEIFFVGDTIFLKNCDIKSTDIINMQSRSDIMITLTDNGCAKLADFTTNHVGSSAAIIVNHQMVSAPRIMAPINNGKLIIVGYFSQKEAKYIARGIIPKN